MNFDSILTFAKLMIKKAVTQGDIVVDATVGNGNDTVFLAELIGKTGHVHGFDIQEQAISRTRERLANSGYLDRVTLHQTGHENLCEVIPVEDQRKITGAMFNLGYLPRGDKTIVTKPDTTITAVNQLLTVMPAKSVIALVVYGGHEEGAVERDKLLEFTKTLDQDYFRVLQYAFINQRNNPPFLIAIEKK